MNRLQNKTQHRKRDYQRAVRLNISLPPSLDQVKDAVVAKYAFGSFSDYVQARLRKDAGLVLAA